MSMTFCQMPVSSVFYLTLPFSPGKRWPKGIDTKSSQTPSNLWESWVIRKAKVEKKTLSKMDTTNLGINLEGDIGKKIALWNYSVKTCQDISRLLLMKQWPSLPRVIKPRLTNHNQSQIELIQHRMLRNKCKDCLFLEFLPREKTGKSNISFGDWQTEKEDQPKGTFNE